jgi:hypothetical protein
MCDQAERDIVDAIPSRAGYFDARQAKSEPDLALRRDSMLQLTQFGNAE